MTSDVVAPAPGQSAGAERWVEFVASGQSMGCEVATIVPDSEIDAIRDGPPPKANTARVDLLKGDEFLRVWINQDGVNYLKRMQGDIRRVIEAIKNGFAGPGLKAE